jgi:hypothetical protein
MVKRKFSGMAGFPPILWGGEKVPENLGLWLNERNGNTWNYGRTREMGIPGTVVERGKLTGDEKNWIILSFEHVDY